MINQITNNSTTVSPSPSNNSQFNPAPTSSTITGASAATGGQSNALSLQFPSGGGALSGLGETFTTDEFTGTSSMAIPFPVSPARGFEPLVSINYSSGQGNSVLGLGFNLGASASITRRTDRGTPRYIDDYSVPSNTDTYLYNGEDLVPKIDSDNNVIITSKTLNGINYNVIHYQPRTQSSFDRIERWQNTNTNIIFWQVRQSNNSLWVYGKTAEGRINNPTNDQQTFEWLLQEAVDRLGNHQRYVYTQENTDNVDLNETSVELAHTHTANRYLSRISYGNEDAEANAYLLMPTEPAVNYLFHVVFDYGEYDVSLTNNTIFEPVNTWLTRRDAFSTYQSGFERRTHRLCRNILMFHAFDELETTQPIVVKSMALEYDEQPELTLLTGVRQHGYIYDSSNTGSPYQRESLPPVDLSYQPFTPQAGQFKPLTGPNDLSNMGETLVGLDEGNQFQLIDLFGEGIPGILYTDNQSALFRYPQQVTRDERGEYELSYGSLTRVAEFPLGEFQTGTTRGLLDLTGDGKVDWVVSTPHQAGFFSVNTDQDWSSFIPFDAFPLEFTQAFTQFADLTGNGLSDAVLIGPQSVRFYENQGASGFSDAEEVLRESGIDLPVSLQGNNKQAIGFSDLLGTGKQHLFRITHKSVEVWPNLGFGLFGRKLRLESPPQINEDDFDPSRLYLADLDGSGTNDLIYVEANQATVYTNQSGNRFATPFIIELPVGFDQVSQVSFADVYGAGAASLILTQTHPEVTHWVYDFTTGNKPYLLKETANNLGARTQIEYRSSAHYLLDDRADGLEWVTAIPFPIQVVSKTVSIDEVSDESFSQLYCYHHGYYDGLEREFRGFGRVDRQDVEAFENTGVDDPELVAPLLSKTWYHTGAVNQPTLTRQYEQEYYQGDPQSQPVADSLIDENGLDLDESEKALLKSDALRGLGGVILRSELYGLDGDIQPDLVDHPYSVTQSRYMTRYLQPALAVRDNRHNAVVQTLVLESLNYNYDRQPTDPVVSQQVTLVFDEFGTPTQALNINYPRRQDDIEREYEESQQRILRVSRQESQVLHIDVKGGTRNFNDSLLLNLPIEERSYEVTGLVPPSNAGVFSFEQLTGQSGPSGLLENATETLLTWTRTRYWDENTQTVLPLGQATAFGLTSHTEAALLNQVDTEALLVTQDQVLTRDELNRLLQEEGRYQLLEGFWWAPSERSIYGLLEQFYQLQRSIDAFEYETLYAYDRYQLTPVQSTDAIGNVTQARLNYRLLQIDQIIDVNENTREVTYDALGRIRATSFFGTEAGSTEVVGFPDIMAFNPTATDIAAALDAPNAALSTASSVMLYDISSWMGQVGREDLVAAGMSVTTARNVLNALILAKHITEEGYIRAVGHGVQAAEDLPLTSFSATTRARVFSVLQSTQRVPVHSASLVAEDYYTQGSNSRVRIVLAYSDGFARELQSKRLVEPGLSFIIESDGNVSIDSENTPVERQRSNRWLTSGRVVYNNKGVPVRQFEPYYLNTSSYIDNEVLNNFGVSDTSFYDPLGRLIKTLTTKGFLGTTTYHSWYQQHFDLNDAVKRSPYYQVNIANPDANSEYFDAELSDEEIRAIENAVLLADTPTTVVIDNQSNTILRELINEGLVTGESFSTIAELSDNQNNNLVQELSNQGILDFRGALTANYNGTLENLSSDFNAHAVAIVSILNKIQTDGELYNHRTVYDIQNRDLRSSDARLGEIGIANFQNVYGFQLLLKTIGQDNGTHWNLVNAVGNPIWSYDSTDVEMNFSYDVLHRPTQQRQIINSEIIIREILSYGESVSNAASFNLRGQLHQAYDQGGRIMSSSFDIQGQLLSVIRQYTNQHREAVSWPSSEVQREQLLEETAYNDRTTFNALSEPLTIVDADGNTRFFTYSISGRIQQTNQQIAGQTTSTNLLSNIVYDARDQLLQETHGNGVINRYDYESSTFRLLRVTATNGANSSMFQDLRYTYDPLGNIAAIEDAAQQTLFNSNQQIEPISRYTYDALYQLIQATGREQGGLSTPVGQDLPEALPLPSASNPRDLYNYQQRFHYDKGNNLQRVQHQSSQTQSTTRLTVAVNGNRAVLDNITDNPERVSNFFDGNGNVTTLGNSQQLKWNHNDQLQRVIVIERASGNHDAEYYAYATDGQRTRKVTETYTNGESVLHIDEVRYLNELEIRTRRTETIIDNQSRIDEELHISTVKVSGRLDSRHFNWVVGLPVDTVNNHYRYSIDNHLGSSTMELDEQARLINYEEYLPYGGTAIQASRSQQEVKYKHYRYAGKERDNITGLYYYGLRYYAPWMGRWLNCDPAGTVDGLNLYRFVRNNPILLTDPDGRQPTVAVYGFSQPRGDKLSALNRQQSDLPAAERTRYITIDEFNNNLGVRGSLLDLYGEGGVIGSLSSDSGFNERLLRGGIERSVDIEFQKGKTQEWFSFLARPENRSRLDIQTRLRARVNTTRLFGLLSGRRDQRRLEQFANKNNTSGTPVTPKTLSALNQFLDADLSTPERAEAFNERIESDGDDGLETRALLDGIISTALFRQTSKLGLGFFLDGGGADSLTFVLANFGGGFLIPETTLDRQFDEPLRSDRGRIISEPITFSEFRETIRSGLSSRINFVAPEPREA